MNRLLSFNPEPFETSSEVEGAFELDGAPELEAEWETTRFARPRTRVLSRPVSLLARAPSAPPVVDSQALRQRIVRVATQELARWNNGTIKETDPRLRKTLQDYWKTGAGVSYSEDQLGDPAFQNAHPWSAAFISWVMKSAGAGDAFKYSASHAVYTRAAKDNRIANNNNPFKAYRITELAPQVGDLVCKSRSGSGATYDNIRPGMKTHCDIVTEVRPRGIMTVGGNVRNSVAQKTLRTDANGGIAEPNYFAVIRIDGQQPSPSPTPAPTPAPPVSVAPRLLRQASAPPGTTLYLEIDLKIVDKFGITAPPVTGVFIPDGYAPGAAVDLILYLHGFKADAIKRQAIDQYWNSQRFPYGAFREGVNASARNVILVAPTLGSHSEAGTLLNPGGLDSYVEQVLAALRTYRPQSRVGAPPTLGNLVLACHSGGGLPMRQLAGGQNRVLVRIRECWGFDCTYNRGDDAFWAGWARARPNAKVYIYYIAGSPTAPLAVSLRNMRVPNAIVQPAKDNRHNYVPMAHWQERLQGASFLGSRSGRSTPPVPPSPRKIPGPVPPPGPFVPPGYVPSSTRVRFEQAVVRDDWRQAFLNLNGLNMYEMLRALDGLSPDRRDALVGQRQAFHDMVNMPRIGYAMAVVRTGRLPAMAPGDLDATGQVQTAAEFIQERQSRQNDIRRMTKKEFIEFVGKNAQRAMAATGVPASVTVAQAIVETGWGKHTIGEAKNLFGIKGRGPLGSVRARTREFIKGKDVFVEADFAKYESFEQSITEHARFFLRNRRFARALQFKDDPDAFAREIHKAGYATDPHYADVLIKYMRDYNLYRFDQRLTYEVSA
jgi:flagellum-specific peptidoglycan hydrolase FlgJ